MIIAIAGLKRSGKDTIADYLVSKYGFIKHSFAEPIKECAKIIFGWDDEHIEGNKKEIIDKRHGISPRQFMQVFGLEIFQYDFGRHLPEFQKIVGNRVWVNLFRDLYEKKKHAYPDVVVSDFRFPHEREVLKEMGATLIRVNRDLDYPKDLHESEKHALTMNVDYGIMNNSTITDLYNQVDKILKEINL